MHTTAKQPWEVRPVGVDFSKVLATGEAILAEASNVTSIVITDKDGTDTTSDMYVAGTLIPTTVYLDADIKGGSEDAGPYKITFRMTTDLGYKWEEDIELTMEDI